MAVFRVSIDEKAGQRMARLRTACNLKDDAELLRLALSTMDILVDHVNDGGRILLEGRDGSTRNFILLPGEDGE